MQASAEANSLDLQAMQSMDWLFKKERIYLLAQFWQQRATLAEKEVTTLKEKLAASTDGNIKTEGQQQTSQNAQSTETSHEHSNPRRSPSINLEQELQAKDKEINQLVDEVTRLQQSLHRLQETSAQTASRLEEELETRRQHIVRLESKLDRQRDYDDIKREISVLRSVDLSQIPTGEPGKSLEHLLMERTKALQQAENLKPPTTPDTIIGGLASPLQRTATASPHGSSSVVVSGSNPTSLTSQQVLPTRSTPTPSSVTSTTTTTTTTSTNLLFPPPLQNVETFGSFLGEEIVANWRRSLERSIINQQQQQQSQCTSTISIKSPIQQSQQFQQSSQLPPLSPTSPQLPLLPPLSQTGLHQQYTSLYSLPTTPNLNQLQSPTDQINSSTSTPVKSTTPLDNLDDMDKMPITDTSIELTTTATTTTSSTVSTVSTTTSSSSPLLSSTSTSTSVVQSITSPMSTTATTTTTTTLTSSHQLSTSNIETNNLLNGTSLSLAGLHLVGPTTTTTTASPKSPHDDTLYNNNNNNNNINNNNINNNNNNSISHHLMMNNNNSNHSINNNNNNNNSIGSISVLDSLKGPFRFDDRTHPFRFGDEFGAAGMAGRLGESLIPKGDPMEARLQEMLRYNMDKYASQNLDTLHIARRVRELLSIHNIGQRLFAKYVLGLSQGTVSELLSKPKPWDKLTEKGRDSYRKMHGWACDENAVMLLKSLIPKKDYVSGKEQGMPTFARGPQDGGPNDMNDERIAHMLNESSHLGMSRSEHDMSNDADSKSPSRLGCPSPLFGKDRYDSQNRRLKKYENDDIPQEKVVRIYQEELAKLMGRRVEDLRGPRDFPPSAMFSHFFSAGGGQSIQGMERTQDEIRIALDAYHRELQKLNTAPGQIPGLPNLPGLLALHQQALHQNHIANGGAGTGVGGGNPNSGGGGGGGGVQDLSLGKIEQRNKIMNGISEEDKEKMEEAMRHAGSAFSLVRPKQEPTQGPQSTPGGSSASSPLGNSILPPAMTPNEEFSAAAAASPLQRMASITNSLISQPSTPTHHSSNQRPLKAVLPPITQQQFDLYNNLNTEDIVKRVKEQLSQYSISQRLFGESVLGLSQGSVSDLLARPKPWHMLTQKGREPFIRMKMFLEDEQAVHKLVASQYKIAPEKLMRTGGYGGLPPCGTPMKPMPPTKLVQEQLQNAAKAQAAAQAAAAAQVAAQTAAAVQHHQEQTQMQLGPPQSSPQLGQHTIQGPQGLMLTSPGSHLASHLPTQLTIQELQKKQHQQQQREQQQQMSGLHSPHQMTPSPLRSLHPHISPSVYEMAALTQDLDTQTITTKIKEALLANNIGQKIFGEAVLGLSQGSVSELLSKPKPWHMLSIKGREPFIRMQLWLSDAHNVDRLQALKNERREANKRRRSSGPGHDNSSDTSSNDTADFYHASNSPGPGPGPGPGPAAKKQRVLFSEEQKEALRLAFALDPYPNVATIEFLAGELGLSSRTITNWFHNHRMRLKQQTPHGQPEQQSPREPGQPFDPVQFRLLLNQRLLEIQKERLGLGNVQIPYSPYFNPNLATLMSNALKEQCSGLDLSMGTLKREPNQEYDDDDADNDNDNENDNDNDDGMSNLGSEDSDGSGTSLKRESNDIHNSQIPTTASSVTSARSSRRKPAAPQWVNPEWQEPTRTGDEVIINGVCVMQTDDYGVKRENEQTVRVEPTPVQDRYDDDCQSDASSISANNGQDRDSPMPASPKSAQNSPIITTTTTATTTTTMTSPRSPLSTQNIHNNIDQSPKDIVKSEPEETWDY
ncbi:homeobox protein cut isoform X3 [Aphidius gifuensis]|uniref:homeobox protein cut isoform X3 n=1 Tax=Aphidius gifuensis TaxID=684658 RepID=UPI001CDD8B19|nr:homeobox protein cut isoform X3 [Aphidius gifuensis]